MSGCLWYSLTTVQGRPRDWFKVKQYLELPDCCQVICQGLAEYVNDPLCFFTGSSTGRMGAGLLHISLTHSYRLSGVLHSAGLNVYKYIIKEITTGALQRHKEDRKNDRTGATSSDVSE